MTYKLTLNRKTTYLHAIVTGLNTRENVARYLEEILQECTTSGYSRVLIEEHLEGPRLGTIDVFNVASQGSSRALGMFKAIAYVDVNAEGDLMQFAENVAVNRALPVRVFRTIADAEKWLLGDTGSGDPSRAGEADRLRW